MATRHPPRLQSQQIRALSPHCPKYYLEVSQDVLAGMAGHEQVWLVLEERWLELRLAISWLSCILSQGTI